MLIMWCMSTKTQNQPATALFDALGSGLQDIACGGASTDVCIAFSAWDGVGIWAGPGDGARSGGGGELGCSGPKTWT